MTDPQNTPPIACTLPTLAEVKRQVQRWHAFEADYAVSVERTERRLIIHYVKEPDSVARLRELVAIERDCCAFVDWSVEETGPDLRLTVTGTPFQLAALNVGTA